MSDRAPRPRRSCLAVPGSNPRFLQKAQGVAADQVFLDLEDACASLAKEDARHAVVKGSPKATGPARPASCVSTTGPPSGPRDVVTVGEGAGPSLECMPTQDYFPERGGSEPGCP